MQYLQALTVKQIKKLQTEVDKLNQSCTAQLKECELQRHAYLTQIGNILHPSVPISATEVCSFVPAAPPNIASWSKNSSVSELLYCVFHKMPFAFF